ncbi:MAG: hypothetical protein QOI66_736, partial [Myxococcales bacterium]|nr:hypothetical protein [Myxococcales bacterium]
MASTTTITLRVVSAAEMQATGERL